MADRFGGVGPKHAPTRPVSTAVGGLTVLVVGTVVDEGIDDVVDDVGGAEVVDEIAKGEVELVQAARTIARTTSARTRTVTVVMLPRSGEGRSSRTRGLHGVP